MATILIVDDSASSRIVWGNKEYDINGHGFIVAMLQPN
jgi:hypothetical protein